MLSPSSKPPKANPPSHGAIVQALRDAPEWESRCISFNRLHQELQAAEAESQELHLWLPGGTDSQMHPLHQMWRMRRTWIRHVAEPGGPAWLIGVLPLRHGYLVPERLWREWSGDKASRCAWRAVHGDERQGMSFIQAMREAGAELWRELILTYASAQLEALTRSPRNENLLRWPRLLNAWPKQHLSWLSAMLHRADVLSLREWAKSAAPNRVNGFGDSRWTEKGGRKLRRKYAVLRSIGIDCTAADWMAEGLRLCGEAPDGDRLRPALQWAYDNDAVLPAVETATERSGRCLQWMRRRPHRFSSHSLSDVKGDDTWVRSTAEGASDLDVARCIWRESLLPSQPTDAEARILDRVLAQPCSRDALSSEGFLKMARQAGNFLLANESSGSLHYDRLPAHMLQHLAQDLAKSVEQDARCRHLLARHSSLADRELGVLMVASVLSEAHRWMPSPDTSKLPDEAFWKRRPSALLQALLEHDRESRLMGEADLFWVTCRIRRMNTVSAVREMLPMLDAIAAPRESADGADALAPRRCMTWLAALGMPPGRRGGSWPRLLKCAHLWMERSPQLFADLHAHAFGGEGAAHEWPPLPRTALQAQWRRAAPKGCEIVELTSRHMLKAEARVMQHCLHIKGSSALLETGNRRYFSIRWPNGQAQPSTVDMEEHRDGSLRLMEHHGPRNQMPDPVVHRAVESLAQNWPIHPSMAQARADRQARIRAVKRWRESGEPSLASAFATDAARAMGMRWLRDTMPRQVFKEAKRLAAKFGPEGAGDRA